ncbi:MAG: 16S rRNA (guanine(966)-N(2))-methyltransferase RsmD [Firmicutes bacterium]|nr:16S rRNA (guanine(966)-N(2))-methyltransferase RsmD [Bacillota bacterium]
MRVISGTAGRTKLKSPKVKNTRPTADRVKEAVFNILNPLVTQCGFLDLFAGSGAIAIEALSRGAKFAVLVEKDYKNIQLIRENLQVTRLSENADIMGMDIQKAFKILKQKQLMFDIIYVDPPYYEGYYENVLEQISACKILKNGGVVVVESSKLRPPPNTVGMLTNVRTQKYGDTLIGLYQHTQQ